jgi:hypothetical protein
LAHPEAATLAPLDSGDNMGTNFADQMSPEVKNAVSEFGSQFETARHLLLAKPGALNNSGTYGLIAQKAVEIFASCAEQLSQEIGNQLPRCHDVNALGAEGQVAAAVLRPLIRAAREAIPDAREVAKQRGLLNIAILEQTIQQHASTLNEKIDIKQAQIRRTVEQRRAEIDREQRAAAEKAENERWQRRHHKAIVANVFQHDAGVSANNDVVTTRTNEVNAFSQELREPLVFLSYASEDRALAEEIANSLMSNSIKVWWAEWEIRTGNSLRQKIDEGLGDCTHFLVLLTPVALTKPWVNQEIGAGFGRKLGEGIEFLPVRADGLQVNALPPLLRDIYSLEIKNPTDLQQLISDIRGDTKKPPLGAPPKLAKPVPQNRGSPAATELAGALVERMESATKLDPQLTESKLPSPEETAREILKIFVEHFNGRPGRVLRLPNFLAVWHPRGLHHDDFKPGMEYAVSQGWIEVQTSGDSFKLTAAGFHEA